MLKEADFKFIYSIFDESVCDFDCGAVCSLKNNGVPFCCEQNVVIPVLHDTEFNYLRKKSRLWSRFVPKNKKDRELFDTCMDNEILAECKGPLKCDRRYRGLVCRTFPFYPYIAENGNFEGLTYNYDFERKCAIIDRPELVSLDYIDSFMRAWSYIFDLDDDEFACQYAMSREIEETRKKRSKNIHIISKNGTRCL